MKILISFGFIILLLIIISLFTFTFICIKSGDPTCSDKFDTFQFGSMFGVLMMVGLISLGKGVIISKDKEGWHIDEL